MRQEGDPGSTRDLLHDFFRPTISRPGLLGHLRWVGQLFASVVDIPLELLRRSPVVQGDETGWRIDGDAIQLGKEREKLDRAAFDTAYRRLIGRFDELMLETRSRHPECGRISERPYEHCDYLNSRPVGRKPRRGAPCGASRDGVSWWQAWRLSDDRAGDGQIRRVQAIPFHS
jgi:hypothetical protein